jgi:hypothetical protein
MTSGGSKLQEEVKKRMVGQKDFARLAEVIPRLRQLLAEEVRSPLTPRSATWLRVAEGIIKFLEEVFQGHEAGVKPFTGRLEKVEKNHR